MCLTTQTTILWQADVCRFEPAGISLFIHFSKWLWKFRERGGKEGGNRTCQIYVRDAEGKNSISWKASPEKLEQIDPGAL